MKRTPDDRKWNVRKKKIKLQRRRKIDQRGEMGAKWIDAAGATEDADGYKPDKSWMTYDPGIECGRREHQPRQEQ